MSETEVFSDCYLLHLDVFLKHTLISRINKASSHLCFENTKPTYIIGNKCIMDTAEHI